MNIRKIFKSMLLLAVVLATFSYTFLYLRNYGAYQIPAHANSANPEVFMGGIEFAVGTISLLVAIFGLVSYLYFNWLRESIKEYTENKILDTVRKSQISEYTNQSLIWYSQYQESKPADENLLKLAIKFGERALQISEAIKKSSDNFQIYAIALSNTLYYKVEMISNSADSKDKKEKELLDVYEQAKQLKRYIDRMKSRQNPNWHHVQESFLYILWKTDGLELDKLKIEVQYLVNDPSFSKTWREDIKNKWKQVLN